MYNDQIKFANISLFLNSCVYKLLSSNSIKHAKLLGIMTILLCCGAQNLFFPTRLLSSPHCLSQSLMTLLCILLLENQLPNGTLPFVNIVLPLTSSSSLHHAEGCRMSGSLWSHSLDHLVMCDIGGTREGEKLPWLWGSISLPGEQARNAHRGQCRRLRSLEGTQRVG